MRLDGDLGHLTYCTNIHAGESWPEVRASLRRNLPAIKAAVAPDRPLGVGLSVAVLVAGIVVSFIGSYFAVRRTLRPDYA